MATRVTTPVLGYDIGGTKIAVCVGDADGTILASDRISGGTRRPYGEILPQLIDMGRRLITEAGITPEEIPYVGISAPGPMDVEKGILEKSPNMVWEDVPIRGDLEAGLGIPAILENDANAGALVEWLFGVARGCRNVVYLTMSTGIGGGVIAEERLVRGVSGNAGELGHAVLDVNGPLCGCGMHGCFEAFCSGRNVALRLQEQLRDQPDHPLMQLPEVAGDLAKIDYQTLRIGVKAGIPLACEFWDQICLRMAQGLGQYIMVFNPEMIILGTIFIYSGEMLMQPVREYLPRFAWPQLRERCRLELPAMGTRIGELAGVAVGLYALRERQAAGTA